MGNPNFKKQVIKQIVDDNKKNDFWPMGLVNLNLALILKLKLMIRMIRLMMQLLMNCMRARKDFFN